MNKVAFLLGAGTSIPAEMPDTEQITRAVLFGRRLSWNSGDESFVAHKEPCEPDKYVLRIQKFLGLLKDMIDSYYPDRDTNYEDLQYVASQLDGDDNPAVQPLIEVLLSSGDGICSSELDLFRLANQATKYIVSVVSFELQERDVETDYLKCITDACVDQKIEKVNICTLNHDKVLEYALSNSSVDFDDGFGERVNDVRYWKPTLLDNPKTKVRMLKLHGSVDWFRCELQGQRKPILLLCPPGTDKWVVKGIDGMHYVKVEPLPGLLVGTRNKDRSYIQGIHFTLYHSFYHSLDEVKYLIVAGYGFRDAGVNVRVLEWARSNAGRKAIVIDPNVERLRKSMGRGTSGALEDMQAQGQLQFINKGIQNVKWQDIVELFKQF